MARLLAFTLLACAAFAVDLPWLDRAGAAALGIAFLAFATPRPPRSITRRALDAARSSITLPTADEGQTPPSLRVRLDPYTAGASGLSAEREPVESG